MRTLFVAGVVVLGTGVAEAEAQAPGSIPTPESVLGHAVGADLRLVEFALSDADLDPAPGRADFAAPAPAHV